MTGSTIIIRKEFSTSIVDNSTSPITADSNEVFLPFDEERYVLTRSDGTIEVLTEDRFQYFNGSNEIVINGLGSNDANCKLIATLRKSSITSKVKRKARIESLVVNKSKYDYSGTGSTSKNDGLVFGDYPFGTRVQDEKICLNVPDVIKIHAIYESTNTSDPVLPSITVGSLDGPSSTTSDLIIGEEFVGTISGHNPTIHHSLINCCVYIY